MNDKMEFLKWFFANADFGPADDDVRAIMFVAYKEETGREVPSEFLGEEEDEWFTGPRSIIADDTETD